MKPQQFAERMRRECRLWRAKNGAWPQKVTVHPDDRFLLIFDHHRSPEPLLPMGLMPLDHAWTFDTSDAIARGRIQFTSDPADTRVNTGN